MEHVHTDSGSAVGVMSCDNDVTIYVKGSLQMTTMLLCERKFADVLVFLHSESSQVAFPRLKVFMPVN